MKILGWVFSLFLLFATVPTSYAAEGAPSTATSSPKSGDTGFTKLACVSKEAVEEIIKSDDRQAKIQEMLARQLCGAGGAVLVTLKKEFRVQGSQMSVWSIEEADLYIIAPRSEGEDS